MGSVNIKHRPSEISGVELVHASEGLAALMLSSGFNVVSESMRSAMHWAPHSQLVSLPYELNDRFNATISSKRLTVMAGQSRSRSALSYRRVTTQIRLRPTSALRHFIPLPFQPMARRPR